MPTTQSNPALDAQDAHARFVRPAPANRHARARSAGGSANSAMLAVAGAVVIGIAVLIAFGSGWSAKPSSRTSHRIARETAPVAASQPPGHELPNQDQMTETDLHLDTASAETSDAVELGAVDLEVVPTAALAVTFAPEQSIHMSSASPAAQRQPATGPPPTETQQAASCDDLAAQTNWTETSPSEAWSLAPIDPVELAALLSADDEQISDADLAHLLNEAASIAQALTTRPAAIRKSCQELVGKETELALKTGAMSGRVAGRILKVTRDGLVVETVYQINGQSRTKTSEIGWNAISHEQLDELAESGGWKIPADKKAVARACSAFVAGDLDAADAAARKAPGDLLTKLVIARVAEARTEAKYAAALERARNRMRQKNFKAATEAAQAALGAKPGDAEAQAIITEAAYASALKRYRLNMRRAEYLKAIEEAATALEVKPEDAEAKLLLAQAKEALHASTTLTLELAPGVAMEFIYVKPGTFVMGGNDDPEVTWIGVEKPKHEVTISRGYYLGKFEVTRAQFAAFAAATEFVSEAEKNGWSTGRRPDGTFGELQGASWRDPIVYPQGDDHPVTCVTWNDSTAFCKWASAKTGHAVRLPTEAEWEFACRAGTTTHFITGDANSNMSAYCWFSGNADWRTHPVGRKQPNAWGFYDMHGNLWEWVQDWYGEDYYAKSPAKDPTGPRTNGRVVCRGGGWHGGGHCCGSSVRRLEGKVYNEPDLGFRVAVTASDKL